MDADGRNGRMISGRYLKQSLLVQVSHTLIARYSYSWYWAHRATCPSTYTCPLELARHPVGCAKYGTFPTYLAQCLLNVQPAFGRRSSRVCRIPESRVKPTDLRTMNSNHRETSPRHVNSFCVIPEPSNPIMVYTIKRYVSVVSQLVAHTQVHPHSKWT